MPKPRLRTLLIGVFVLIAAYACGPLSNAGLTTTEPPLSASQDSLLTPGAGLASTETLSSSVDDFPLTPNPVTVHAVLDTAQAVSMADSGTVGSWRSFPLMTGETTDGIKFFLSVNQLLSLDPEDNLVPALGTQVTLTPVSAIQDIPFSQGYLAAFHIGPEGLSMVYPGFLQLDLPGNYDESQLIGFAAEASGEDFHLIPIDAWSNSVAGTTLITFSIEHFSLYGVALVTQQEIEAQVARPPANPVSQDEQEIASVTPAYIDEELAPLLTKVQLRLNKSYDRLLKREIERLPYAPCKEVPLVAAQFEAWKTKVNNAKQGSVFKSLIQDSAKALLRALTECARPSCESCLKAASTGENFSTASAASLLTIAAYASDMARILELVEERNYWSELSSICSRSAGLPQEPSVADCSGDCPEVEPLVCK